MKNKVEADSPIDLQRLLIALAYATGALIRNRAPSPSQIEEDRRFAGVCWELAQQVKQELDRCIVKMPVHPSDQPPE